MRGWNRLTATRIAKLDAPGRYADGGNLWLQVSPGGTKAWLFRYTLDGRARQMGLGPLHAVSLAEARELARDARQHLTRRLDPIDARRKAREDAKAEDAKRVTFRDAAERYIAAHAAGWRNAKHAEQWRATLEAYAYPQIGDLPVAAVNTGLVLKILEPIWASKTETASRLRGRIEAVLDWATARHLRFGDNPARWRGHLDKLLPAKTKVRRVVHYGAMPYENVPTFMMELPKQEGMSARALEFTILTAARTGETIGARWPEMDLASKVWTVPGMRTKSGREHRVPLSERAVALLKALPREHGNDHVFIGSRYGAGLSNMAMLELVKPVGITVHGFRSSFRDWAAEATGYPNHVVEMALAHVIGDKVEAAYRRGDLFEKRRRLMRDWAKFVGSPAITSKVVPMRKARV